VNPPLNQLNRAFDGRIKSRSKQKVNVLWHNDKNMKLITAITAVAIKGFQKETDVIFNDEQLSAMMGGESNKVRSGRGEGSSRLQERTSATNAAIFAWAKAA
jgi:hypothetical protein